MKPSVAQFDVYLSHNAHDQAAVERIVRALRDRGLTVFLDEGERVLGGPWRDALAEHLNQCGSVVVVLGPAGMGPWQQREQELAPDRRARDDSFRVIPVILPDADPAPALLLRTHWVDLRGGVDNPESMDLLAAAVRQPSSPRCSPPFVARRFKGAGCLAFGTEDRAGIVDTMLSAPTE